MRFPPNWSMELLLVVALFASVIVTIFALKEPPGDRTRFTLERSDATRFISERSVPIVAEETALGR
jgi:hypothetical protein